MENKTNDWFAARLLNVDKPVDFLINEGVDVANSNLQDKDFYKDKAKVQEIFKKEDGTFDKDKYEKFYNDVSLEYTYLNSIDTENYILNAYEKSGSNFSTDFGTVIDPKIDAERIKNPQDLSFGMTNVNEWSSPTKSVREMAQKNQYFDNDIGKWSEKTVNEAGVLGLLSGKSLVYASWNEDGVHVDPFSGKEESHKKGDWKTDEFGNFYAETVSNEENIDKQFVTWNEVITDDDSPWNKVDIFDSDNLNSNIARTLIKGTAIVGSSVLFPTVGATLFYTTAAVNLARVLPQVSKSISAFFGADDFDSLNKWDNTMRRFGRSSSDYSQEHFFSLENILNMAIDSYMQLGTQRAIAQLPQKLGIGSNAAKQMATAEMIQRLKLAQSGKVSQEVIEALAKSTSAYRAADKVFNNASKISTAISRGYLITTSVEDVYNSAKSYGFDSQTAGFISLATYAGIGALFQTDYFRGMLYNTPDYEVARDIKLLTRQWLKGTSDKIKKDLTTATTDVAKQSKLKGWGNSLLKHIKNHAEEVSSGRFGIVSGAINEGLEEVTEEVVQDLSFQVGKSWQAIKETLTGNTYNNEYSYAQTDPLARYGMSLFGGALGGAIFKLSDRIHLQKNAYKTWKEMMGGDNSQLMKELVHHVSQGRTSMILKQIDKLQESPILSTSISAFTGESTANPEESQNHVIFNMFKKSIIDTDAFLNNNNLAIDYERFGDIELLRGVRTAWLTSVAGEGKGIQNSLFEDYQKRITEIVNLQNDIKSKQTTLSDNAKQEEVDTVKEETSKMKKVLDFKIEQVRKLVSGQDDSYIGRLMLESNKDILDKIAPTSKDGLSKYLYGIKYSELPTIYKSEIDKQHAALGTSGLTEINYMSAWNIYKNISGEEEVRNIFSSVDSKFNKFIPINSLSLEERQEFIIVREAFRKLQPFLNDAQVLNLFYKAKGIDSPVFDFQNDGVIESLLPNNNYEQDADAIYESWKSALESASEKVNENPEIINEWSENYEVGKTTENFSNSEGFSLITTELSKDDFKHLIQTMYNSLEENPMTHEIGLRGRDVISSTEIDSLISSINSKVDETIDIGIIQQQYNLLKSQGNKYFMSDDIFKSLKSLNNLLDLVESISEGSNSERRADILDIPFGANNFLNKTFKEKGINLELSQITSNTLNAIKTRIYELRHTIDLLIETASKNKGAVITTEKKIGIKYSEFKILTIQRLLEDSNIPQELKDKLVGLDFTTPDLDILETDDDYVDLSAKYRNTILQFEREFFNYWSTLDDVGKIDLIKTIVSIFPERLSYDTSSLTSKIIETKGTLLNDATAYMYLMSCSFGNSDKVLKEYKENIQNSNKFPFDSQEDLIITISKFLLKGSNNDTKLWISNIASEESFKKEGQTVLYNALKVVCSGGTGKTSVLLSGVFNIISKVIPNKNVIFASNTINQIKAIQDSIPNSNTMLISDILSDSTDLETFNTKYGDSILFIDECTNIDTADLKILEELSLAYNVDIVYLGDVKQHSNGYSIDEVVCPMTIQLTESKRSSTDISRSNNNIFEELFKQDNSGIPNLNQNKLDKFIYWDSENTLEGVKFEDPGTLTNEFIADFYKRYNLPTETKVLVFSNNLSSLDIGNLSKTYGITFSNNFADIQGIEWDYVLTDINLTVKGDGSDDYFPVYNKLKDVYTLFTRPKHGLISLQPLILEDLTRDNKGLYKADHTNIPSTFAPVESGIINDQAALSQFIEYKLQVLDKVDIIDSTVDSSNDTEEQTSYTSSSTIQRPINVSLAQVTSGFLLKKNFTDEFLNSINVSANDYGIIRNVLYTILTSEEDVEFLKSKLPEKLQNGKFLIKTEYVTVDDLYDMGNLYRDNKSLKGVHPWIVYHIDGHDELDIYLGMFQNAETSKVNDSEISQTSSVINSLTVNMLPNSAPKYYDIPNKLHISRSSNVIDIQNKETESGAHVGLTYDNGRVVGSNVNGNDQRLNFLESSLSIYFRRGNENIVKVNSILEELNNLRTLYSKFYELSIKSGLYTTDVEPIKELLHYDRKNKTWAVRGVPDLEDKFVIFTKLQLDNEKVSPTAYLQSSSNSYLSSLKSRSSQLVEIVQVLESAASTEYKKDKINEILSNRILFTTVPISFDPDVSKDKESFREAIDNITYDTFRGSNRSRKAYNDAITHQFGYTLRRIAGLVKFGDQLKLAKNSKTWFDSSNLTNIKNVWNTYKDGLVSAYKQWSGLEDADESSLLTFLTETFTLSYTGKNSETVPVFMNNNVHLLQTTEFKKFLEDIYQSSGWTNMVNKLNTIKHFKLSPELKVMFSGHLFPHIIKDNGINVLTKGDALTIVNNTAFNLSSKVIQQGRIFVYGNESINIKDFNEYVESKESEPKKVEPIVSKIQEEIKETVDTFNEANFKKELINIGRKGGRRISIEDRKQLGKLVSEISRANNEYGIIINDTILKYAESGDFNSFRNTVEELSQKTPEQIRGIIDNILAVISSDADLC